MSGALAGKRILIVEDEYFIASDLKSALMAEDAIVVGPVGDLATGLSLAETEPLDAAVLDVNLAGVLCYPLSNKLDALSVPHMFLTGYDSWLLPDVYRDKPRLAKPFSTRAAVAMVERLCAGAPAS